MRITTTLIAAAILTGTPLAAGAKHRDNDEAGPAQYGVGVKLGTLGIGLEGTRELGYRLNLRVGANYARHYRYDSTVGDVRYNAELDLASLSAMIDWHPFKYLFGGIFSPFRITVGVFADGNELSVESAPPKVTRVGNGTYTPAQIGRLEGKVEFANSVAPYIGIGWGNATAQRKRIGIYENWGLGVAVDFGLLIQGRKTVTSYIATNGGVSQSDLEEETRRLEGDLDNLELYPVISVGISYDF